MTNTENTTQREWWVLKWLDLLDKYRFKKRLERGRNYAREGNILSINFEGSKVTANVQGNAEDPYELWIRLDQFSDEDWNYIIQSLAEKAIFSAQLLAGEMPENIEDVFVANGLSLFPFSLSDVHAKCSCPDPKNPCKHIAAVYYELADRFSEDPFVLFQLRGRTKDEILAQVRKLRQEKANDYPPFLEEYEDVFEEEEEETNDGSTKTIENQETVDLEQFWNYEDPLDSSLVQITADTDQTVLEVLGGFPLPSREAQAVRQYLEQVQKQVQQTIVDQT